MVVRIILLFLPGILFAGFTQEDVGRKIVGIADKPGRGLSPGEVYEITHVHTDFHASINSPGVGIHYDHFGLFQDWFHDYTINQQLVETISFISGATLFLVFSRGFESPI
tara:strand:+ start:4893 stop:5222 length:330 start_codon:yes stop_codon:yes gene_type:complete